MKGRRDQNNQRVETFRMALVLWITIGIFQVHCHGYVKSWSEDDGQTWILGQKQPLANSSLRGFSENTGWIGSQFLTNPAIVCSSSLTPSLKVVAPSGDLFSRADQSAGKTLSVSSGATIRLLLNDEEHKVYPHENGHIQVYLGYCGSSATACENFDAATISYFKILSLKQGLGSKTEFPYNKKKDGNELKVPILNNFPMGSYILRLELIVFGQSSEAEGKQDQYYITCGQIALSSPTDQPSMDLSTLESVKFPGAYKNGNLDPKGSPPGPAVIKNSNMTSPTSRKQESDQQDLTVVIPVTSSAKSSFEFKPDSDVPQCAKSCLAKKISEHQAGDLGSAGPCTDGIPTNSTQVSFCQCKDQNFLKAFQSCAFDNCKDKCEVQKALDSFDMLCGIGKQTTKPSNCQSTIESKRKRSNWYSSSN